MTAQDRSFAYLCLAAAFALAAALCFRRREELPSRDDALDEALKETFPASDSLAIR